MINSINFGQMLGHSNRRDDVCNQHWCYIFNLDEYMGTLMIHHPADYCQAGGLSWILRNYIKFGQMLDHSPTEEVTLYCFVLVTWAISMDGTCIWSDKYMVTLMMQLIFEYECMVIRWWWMMMERGLSLIILKMVIRRYWMMRGTQSMWAGRTCCCRQTRTPYLVQLREQKHIKSD